MYLCVFDAIGCAADGLAEVGGIVGFVELGLWKGQDYVMPVDIEFLDGGSVGEEGEC